MSDWNTQRGVDKNWRNQSFEGDRMTNLFNRSVKTNLPFTCMTRRRARVNASWMVWRDWYVSYKSFTACWKSSHDDKYWMIVNATLQTLVSWSWCQLDEVRRNSRYAYPDSKWDTRGKCKFSPDFGIFKVLFAYCFFRNVWRALIPLEFLDETYPAKILEGWGYCEVKIS